MEFLSVNDVATMGMMLMTMMIVMIVIIPMLKNMFTLTQMEMDPVLIIIMLMITVFFKMRMEIPQVCVPQFSSSLILVDFLNCL